MAGPRAAVIDLEVSMDFLQDGYLLRIFIGESDKHEGKPLYEWLVQEAKASQLAGGTGRRGIRGFGASSRIHTSKLERLSLDLPIVVEIVDSKTRLEDFLKHTDPAITGGMATLEKT